MTIFIAYMKLLVFVTCISGFWFFHCHIEFHVEIGMAVIIQVGDKDDMPPTPKGFPKCGNWYFSGYQEEETKTCGSTAKSFSLIVSLLSAFITFSNILTI